MTWSVSHLYSELGFNVRKMLNGSGSSSHKVTLSQSTVETSVFYNHKFKITPPSFIYFRKKIHSKIIVLASS